MRGWGFGCFEGLGQLLTQANSCLSCCCNESRNLCAYYRVAIWYEEYPMFSGKKEKKKISLLILIGFFHPLGGGWIFATAAKPLNASSRFLQANWAQAFRGVHRCAPPNVLKPPNLCMTAWLKITAVVHFNLGTCSTVCIRLLVLLVHYIWFVRKCVGSLFLFFPFLACGGRCSSGHGVVVSYLSAGVSAKGLFQDSPFKPPMTLFCVNCAATAQTTDKGNVGAGQSSPP